MSLSLQVLHLGRRDYLEALTIQRNLHARRLAEEIGDTLILVEHPPVITLGKRGEDSDILAPPETLAEAGATVHRIERGGQTTYHGPGQIVGYAIIHLYNHNHKIRRFIENLEEVFVRLLDAEYGITAEHGEEHRGVWVADNKITATGIAVRNKVTFHGFAFNADPDLSHFNWIVACGITDKGQTSVARELGRPIDLEEARGHTLRYFAEVFGYEVIAEVDSPQALRSVPAGE
jgi:lipoyl(octanoyl) transferase